MLEIKKVNLVDEEYDKYLDEIGANVCFHISKNAFAMLNGEPKKINIINDLNLKMESCKYGANTDYNGNNRRMKTLADLIEKKFGTVDWGEEGGLHISLEISLMDGSKAIYFLAGGNKGQELCVGMYIKSIEQLADNELKETIIYLDNWLYNAVVEAQLEEF